MNRQQRRMLARQKEVEQKYLTDLEDRQNRRADHNTETILVGVALALNQLYGWTDRGIERVIHECMKQVSRLEYGETLYDLVTDLEKRTGISIKVKRE